VPGCARCREELLAVGRARCVVDTSWARVAGPDSSALITRAALSMTPTPLLSFSGEFSEGLSII